MFKPSHKSENYAKDECLGNVKDVEIDYYNMKPTKSGSYQE